MKKIWKVFAYSCCAMGALVLSVTAPQVMAAENGVLNGEEAAPVLMPNTAQQWQRTMGVIAEITQEKEDYLVLVKVENGEQQQIRFVLSPETPIIDNETALPLQGKDLQVGERVCVSYGPAMTFSLPPQTVAYSVVANVKEEKAPALFLEVTAVEKGEKRIQVTSADGNYILFFTPETTITPFRTKNIVTVDDIVPGSRLFAWFDIMTLSLPAQATPYRAVLVSVPEQEPVIPGEEPAETADEIGGAVSQFHQVVINGQVIDIGEMPLQQKEDGIWLPIRKVGGALGFGVEWIEWKDAAQNSTFALSMSNGSTTITMTVGEDTYFVKEQEKATAFTGKAPVLVGDHTFIPLEMLVTLLPLEVTVRNGVLEIIG